MRDPKATKPAKNSARNSEQRDVVGNKTDDHNGDSIMAEVHTMLEHVHAASKVYPTLVDGVPVTAGAAGPPWVLGAFTEIVPASGIGTDFDIHFICIENLDANDEYELVLYAVETEIGRCRFVKNANLDAAFNVPIQTPIQAADTQIQAKLASDAGGSIATISLFYHEYN